MQPTIFAAGSIEDEAKISRSFRADQLLIFSKAVKSCLSQFVAIREAQPELL
jgi:hypothetical protein